MDRLTERPIGGKHGRIDRGSKTGFSLVELLVVVAIVALLAGLLVPAVQAARESARRGICQQNLRQLAMAVLAYEAGSRRLPAAASVSEAVNPATCTGCWNPWAEARLASFTPGTKHGSSWILTVLPFLEQVQLFDRWNRFTNVLGNAAVAQTDIPSLYCPSRRAGIRIDRDDLKNLINGGWRGGGTDYGGCYGRGDGFLNDTSDDHRFSDIDTPISGSTGNRQGLFLPNVGRPLSAASDGLAGTIMLGELQRLRPLPGGAGAANTANRTSQDGWAAGGVATLFVTATDPGHSNPGGMNNFFFESPGSEHVGGGFFAMADGAIRWIGEFVDAKDNNAVFPLLGSIRDGAETSLADAGH